MNWNNLPEVIALAKKLGPGMVVIKHSDRTNYNITHAERRDRWDNPNITVLHKT